MKAKLSMKAWVCVAGGLRRFDTPLSRFSMPVRLRPKTTTVAGPSSTSAPAMTRAWRAAVAIAGGLPVALIAVSMFGGPSLRTLAVVPMGPVLVVVALLTGRARPAWALMSRTLLMGLVATALYDLFRFSLLALGVLEGDPIPHLGTALGLEPAWIFGYLWRYVGDGGGLALAFVALGFRGVRAGILFGLAICCGLLLTLALSPHGQAILFPLGLNTVVMATIGHVIYGAVLGRLAAGSPRRLPASVPAPAVVSLKPRATTETLVEEPVERRSA